MQRLVLLLFFTVSALVKLSGQAIINPRRKNLQNIVIDYPQALQKAGVKKIRCIFKDSRQFVWIGTENGLYRYDGTNTDLLEHEAGNRNTIPHNTVTSITEDNRGNIWIGTLQGAGKIDPRSFSCMVYNKQMHNLNDDFDAKIFIDHKGRIWASSNNGLSLLNAKTGIFTNVWRDRDVHDNGKGYINCLADWKNDTLIAGTFNGIALIDKKTFKSRRVNPLNERLTAISLFVDGDKKIWIGTWGNGCLVFDKGFKTFKNIKWESFSKNQPANIVTGIIRTNYGGEPRIWASTSKGVYEFDENTGQDEKFTAERVAGLQNGFIYGILADDEQHIWQAGDKVSRFFAGNNLFSAMPVNVDGYVSDIQQVNIQDKKEIAFSSWYNPSGLLIASPDGRQVTYRQPLQPASAAGNVSGIVKDKYGRFWVSSLGGVQVLDSALKPLAVNTVSAGYKRLRSLKSNAILINHDTVWVGCYKNGIELYDLNLRLLKTFKPGDSSGLFDNLVDRFYADRRGDVWVCGDYFLYRYNRQQGAFKTFNFNKDETRLDAHNMAELPGGEYLVASGSGLFRFNANTGSYKKIVSPIAGRERDVPSVAVDGRGDIWYINNSQLVYYQVKTAHFTSFGSEDGLDNYGDLSCLRTFDGQNMYMAEGKKIISFSLPAGQANERPIKLYLHSLQVNDSAISRNALQQPLVFRYNENKLNLEFGAINYIKPAQNLYAYRLSGVDGKWVISNNNNASYTNLSPGKYTFKVKAENYAGIWGKPVSLDFTIKPPYWGAWWFRLISFVLVSSLLFSAIRYVLQRNLREKILYLEKEKAIEQERNRIARDMHDDLGSGLTKIAVLSEVTKAQLANQAATTYLDVISASSRELVDNLQGIIWVLNPKNDSVESLVLYLKEYCESFFEHTTIYLQFVYDDGIGDTSLSEEKRRNIFLVVKECCNNVLKHADCTSVSIRISLQDGILQVGISDNGKGFETTGTSLFSNGLHNMKNRMQQISGDFQLVSEAGCGTSVSCRIPV